MANIFVQKEMNPLVNAITHTAPHHGDEVFATAMLSFLFPLHVYRTRDQELIDSLMGTPGYIIYDVGGVYNPALGAYDHHGRDFHAKRDDGILYSSAGLIWRDYGVAVVMSISPDLKAAQAQVVVDKIDSILIRGIDARDNGASEEVDEMTVSDVVSSFNPNWDDESDPDDGFVEACEFARMVLEREVKAVASVLRGVYFVERAIADSNGAYIILERYVGGWIETVLKSHNPKANGLLYCVFCAKNGDWSVQAIPPSFDRLLGQRKPFPESWRGLRDGDLVSASGVETATFCHNAGFFAVAKTRGDAIALATLAAEA